MVDYDQPMPERPRENRIWWLCILAILFIFALGFMHVMRHAKMAHRPQVSVVVDTNPISIPPVDKGTISAPVILEPRDEYNPTLTVPCFDQAGCKLDLRPSIDAQEAPNVPAPETQAEATPSQKVDLAPNSADAHREHRDTRHARRRHHYPHHHYPRSHRGDCILLECFFMDTAREAGLIK